MAKVRARAWEHAVARHGSLPSARVAGAPLAWPRRDRHDSQGQDVGTVVPVVIRLDATVILAASAQEGAEPNYKGFGFHPVRREALLIRAEVRDHRHRSCRSRTVKLRTA